MFHKVADKCTFPATGYGDIHAVNLREMIFIMVYVSFDMILGAYLIGNMTALIVKGSKTEKFRDKMTDLIKYMNRTNLEGIFVIRSKAMYVCSMRVATLKLLLFRISQSPSVQR